MLKIGLSGKLGKYLRVMAEQLEDIKGKPRK